MNERTTMWEEIGTNASVNDFDVLMKEADLDYTVVTKDLFIESDDSKIMVPNRKMVVREDNNKMFGIVSDRYQVCQNSDAFDFVKYIDGIELIKAGSVGSSVYMIGQLPEVTVLGDTIRPNLIFQNNHDGTSSIKSTICMLRIICQNQFITSFKDSPATVKISHLGDIEEKLIVAKETLNNVYYYIKNFKETANELAGSKITPTVFNKIVDKFFSTNAEYSERTNKRIEEDRERFINALNVDDNSNFVKTKWGMVNAYSDFITHSEPVRKIGNWKETRFLWYLNPSFMDTFIDFVKAA